MKALVPSDLNRLPRPDPRSISVIQERRIRGSAVLTISSEELP